MNNEGPKPPKSADPLSIRVDSAVRPDTPVPVTDWQVLEPKTKQPFAKHLDRAGTSRPDAKRNLGVPIEVVSLKNNQDFRDNLRNAIAFLEDGKRGLVLGRGRNVTEGVKARVTERNVKGQKDGELVKQKCLIITVPMKEGIRLKVRIDYAALLELMKNQNATAKPEVLSGTVVDQTAKRPPEYTGDWVKMIGLPVLDAKLLLPKREDIIYFAQKLRKHGRELGLALGASAVGILLGHGGGEALPPPQIEAANPPPSVEQPGEIGGNPQVVQAAIEMLTGPDVEYFEPIPVESESVQSSEAPEKEPIRPSEPEASVKGTYLMEEAVVQSDDSSGIWGMIRDRHPDWTDEQVNLAKNLAIASRDGGWPGTGPNKDHFVGVGEVVLLPTEEMMRFIDDMAKQGFIPGVNTPPNVVESYLQVKALFDLKPDTDPGDPQDPIRAAARAAIKAAEAQTDIAHEKAIRTLAQQEQERAERVLKGARNKAF